MHVFPVLSIFEKYILLKLMIHEEQRCLKFIIFLVLLMYFRKNTPDTCIVSLSNLQNIVVRWHARKVNDIIWKCRFVVILLFNRFRKCFRNHLTSNYEGRYHLELYKYIFCKLHLPLTELESWKYYKNSHNIKHIEMSWIFCILHFAFNRSLKI